MIDNKKTYILCSANWYDDGKVYHNSPINIKHGFVVCGRRHPDIIWNVHHLAGKQMNHPTNENELQGTAKQGFMGSDNRFYTRQEAEAVARACGQLTTKIIGGILTSEDLW